MPDKEVKVTPGDTGGWVVENTHTVERYERKRDAELRGRTLLRERGGGELVVRNLSGKIVVRGHVHGGPESFS